MGYLPYSAPVTSDPNPDDAAATRAKRDSVFRSAQIVIDGVSRELACRVRNISDTGTCVDHKGELKQGMRVRIAIGKEAPVAGRVMWASDKLAGIAFAGAHGVPDAPIADPLTPTAGWLAERPDPYRR